MSMNLVHSLGLFIGIAVLFSWPVCASEKFTGYLFAYFTGNNISQEAIRFAVSDDGHKFKALNKNNPVISSASISSTGGVRDPHILRGENNDYYMVATDMVSAKGWASNRGLVMLKSTNLIDWKSGAVNVPNAFPTYAAADRVWAPQVIFDRVTVKYMVYFAMRLGPNDRDKIYYAYADSAFTKLETVPKLLYAYGNQSAIDADIICRDSTFHLFFKTEGSGNGIKSALSNKLTEGYVLFDKYLQITNAAVEGSCVFKLIDSDTYVLMYDMYTSGKYEFALGSDLKNFTLDPTPISFDFTPRHGTIIPITDTEKRVLYAKWSSIGIRFDAKKETPRFPAAHANECLMLSGGAFSGGTVLITALSGKEVFRRTVAEGEARIQLPGLPAGVYQVTCGTGDRSYGVLRIVVR
jgi:arabinoxylan arabinofuranohydrolase